MVLKKNNMATSACHKPLINFLRGWPNPSLLPAELIRSAADAVLTSETLAVPAMEYGPDEGDARLRKELANWLSDFNSDWIKESISPDSLAITGGASQNLACVLQTFTDPEYTRNIWIVAPAYFLAFRIFNDAGFGDKLRSVPEDEEGLNLEYLRREITVSERRAEKIGNAKPAFKVPTGWGKIYKHIIYAVPTYSNPSSKTMSFGRRKELVRLAREFDALVVTDDVYDQLQWPASPTANAKLPLTKSHIPRIVDMDRALDGGPDRSGADGFGNAASSGSFSKIIGPGMRTGWCQGTAKFAYGLSQTGSSRSGGAPSQIAATFLAQALSTGGVQRHVYETLQPTYCRRWTKMRAAIEKYLVPMGVKLPQDDRQIVGGYFIWLQLPAGISAKLLSRRCKETENLVVAEGALFEVPGDTKVDAEANESKSNASHREPALTAFPYAIRLCFAAEEESRLEEGIQRLAVVIKQMMEEPVGLNPQVSRSSFRSDDGHDQSAYW